ncbi:restriction endonuclease, partial [Acinetobacter baumannii]
MRYWCELILGNEIPFAVKGINQARSILFPMEKLFEKYVEIQLSKQLIKGAKLEAQKSSKYLAQYNSKDIFNLIPDLTIQ